MTRSKLPWVFRITATLLVAVIVIGGWWQPQPVGLRGQAFLTAVVRTCPAAASHSTRPTVADTARALDRVAYMVVTDMLLHDNGGRCSTGATR